MEEELLLFPLGNAAFHPGMDRVRSRAGVEEAELRTELLGKVEKDSEGGFR